MKTCRISQKSLKQHLNTYIITIQNLNCVSTFESVKCGDYCLYSTWKEKKTDSFFCFRWFIYRWHHANKLLIRNSDNWLFICLHFAQFIGWKKKNCSKLINNNQMHLWAVKYDQCFRYAYSFFFFFILSRFLRSKYEFWQTSIPVDLREEEKKNTF